MIGLPASEILFDTDMGVEPADFVPEFMFRGGGIVIFRRADSGVGGVLVVLEADNLHDRLRHLSDGSASGRRPSACGPPGRRTFRASRGSLAVATVGGEPGLARGGMGAVSRGSLRGEVPAVRGPCRGSPGGPFPEGSPCRRSRRGLPGMMLVGSSSESLSPGLVRFVGSLSGKPCRGRTDSPFRRRA